MMNPAFKDVEISRMRSQVISSLKKKVDNPSAYTDEQMDLFLFGEHPYGRDVNGTVDGVKALTKQEIIKHYLTFYRPNNATMAVVGQFDDAFEKQVQDVFSKWTKRTIPVVAVATPPPVDNLQVKLIVKKGLKQTQIRLSQVGIDRKDPDFIHGEVVTSGHYQVTGVFGEISEKTKAVNNSQWEIEGVFYE
jgi:zinc protease